MNCKKCGKPLEEGATFCTECGTQVTPDSAANTNDPQPVQQNPVNQVQQPQSQPQAGPYGTMPQNSPVSAPGGMPPAPQFDPIEPKKKKPMAALFAALGVVVVIIAVIGVRVVLKNSAIQSEVDVMQEAFSKSENLYDKTEELMSEAYPDFPKEGLTAADIDDMLAQADEIKPEPDGDYAREVKEKLDISEHKERLEDIKDALDDLKDKLTAAEKVNAIIEGGDAVNGAYEVGDPLPIAVGADKDTIDSLYDEYVGKDSGDDFWNTVQTILDDSVTEIEWIVDAEAAVAELEALDSFTQEEYDYAMEEVDYLYDGAQKANLETRLTLISSKIKAAEASTEPEAAGGEDVVVDDSISNAAVFGDYATMEEFVADNYEVFGIDELNEGFEGMAEADILAEGNKMIIRVTFDSTFDSLMDLMKPELETQMDDIDEVYEPLAAMLRIQFSDAELAVEFCKSDGSIVVSKTY